MKKKKKVATIDAGLPALQEQKQSLSQLVLPKRKKKKKGSSDEVNEEGKGSQSAVY